MEKSLPITKNSRFGPLNALINSQNYIHMTVDEYETIRLIDLEGFTQEECACQMHIARTTVQGIYNHARKKLAQCLVNGKVLWIEGREYRLCEGYEKSCSTRNCCKYKVSKQHKNYGNTKGGLFLYYKEVCHVSSFL